MKIFGEICPKHPLSDGWRIQYKNGSTICCDCNVERVRRWRAANPAQYAKQQKAVLKKSKTPTARKERNERLRAARAQARLAADKKSGV